MSRFVIGHSNTKGFSLIEIMVVVALMAILATVALPSYRNFRARALQKEGFALLSAYYSSAQATRVEFGRYPGNFVQTGFQPDGRLGYRLRAADNGNDINLGWNDDGCVETDDTCSCGGVCAAFKIWTEEAVGSASTPGVADLSTFDGACGTIAAVGTTDATFSIRVGAWLGTDGDEDVYGMNQNKDLVMCQDGLN